MAAGASDVGSSFGLVVVVETNVARACRHLASKNGQTPCPGPQSSLPAWRYTKCRIAPTPRGAGPSFPRSVRSAFLSQPLARPPCGVPCSVGCVDGQLRQGVG